VKALLLILQLKRKALEQSNLKYIQCLSQGDKALENRIIKNIILEFQTDKKVYFSSISNKNYERPLANVHKLKNKISILDLNKGYKLAEKF
jgi:hypothetical protein